VGQKAMSPFFRQNRIIAAARKRIGYDFLLLPYALYRHRRINKIDPKNNRHTYTAFFRSPRQMQVLLEEGIGYLNLDPDAKLTVLVFASSNGAEAYSLASEMMYRNPDREFKIIASDLHYDLVEKSKNGVYSRDEVFGDRILDPERIERTFDIHLDKYVVKEKIKAHCDFFQVDLLHKENFKNLPKADIILAQNVFFHMQEHHVISAFESIQSCMKKRSVLLIDGMNLDLRIELTRKFGLIPLKKCIRAIHQDARRHIPEKWWTYYFGIEPFRFMVGSRSRRYATIFLKESPNRHDVGSKIINGLVGKRTRRQGASDETVLAGYGEERATEPTQSSYL
jgi:chemotaxis protein methyltransferase CheR